MNESKKYKIKKSFVLNFFNSDFLLKTDNYKNISHIIKELSLDNQVEFILLILEYKRLLREEFTDLLCDNLISTNSDLETHLTEGFIKLLRHNLGSTMKNLIKTIEEGLDSFEEMEEMEKEMRRLMSNTTNENSGQKK